MINIEAFVLVCWTPIQIVLLYKAVKKRIRLKILSEGHNYNYQKKKLCMNRHRLCHCCNFNFYTYFYLFLRNLNWRRILNLRSRDDWETDFSKIVVQVLQSSLLLFHQTIIKILSHVLAYTNSCLNPILYAKMSRNFRWGFTQVISGLKKPSVICIGRL